MRALVQGPLAWIARAEQVDDAEEALVVAHLLALDAVVPRAPRAVLGLVGDAQVDLHATRPDADVPDVHLGWRARCLQLGAAAGHRLAPPTPEAR